MFEQIFKNIDDILHKDAGCTCELDYTEQSSWLLFLKYLDALEINKAMEAELEGKAYKHILDVPYRWATWAAPKAANGQIDHNAAMTGDDLKEFVNHKLIRAFKICAIPSIADQQRIVNHVNELFDTEDRLVSLYRQKITALDDLKKSLLHQAFSGQL